MSRLAKRFDTLLQLKAVIDLGSMNKAAKIIGASQPSLTRNISQLELVLGVKLLNRTPKGVFPTVFGEALLKHITAADEELNRALGELNILRGAMQGSIACGGSAAAIQFLLPAAVKHLQDTRPQVQVRLAEGYTPILLQMLRRGELDIVVSQQLTDNHDPDLETVVLAAEDISIVARAGHRAAGHKNTLRQLAESEQWILPSANGGLYPVLQEVFEQKGAAFPIHAIETSSLVAMRWLVRETDRIAVICPAEVAKEIIGGRMVTLVGDWQFPESLMTACYRRTDSPTPLLKAFRTSLEAALSLRPGLPPADA